MAFLTGCAAGEDKGGEAGEGGEGGETDDLPVIGEPSNVTMDDSSDGVRITIEGSTASGWRFGNIYPDTDEYEEACLNDADTCHELGADGGSLDWCDRANEECSEMAQLYWRTGRASFVLIPAFGLGCFTWGDNADYWDSLGCTITGWNPSSYY